MSPDDVQEVERLKGLMLKKVFYVMTRRMVAPDRAPAVLLDHYRWIIALEKEGRVFASGPLSGKDGGPGVGMTVFRTDSFEDAEALAATDPFCASGAAEFEVKRWQINEGRMTLSLDVSDQSVRLD